MRGPHAARALTTTGALLASLACAGPAAGSTVAAGPAGQGAEPTGVGTTPAPRIVLERPRAARRVAHGRRLELAGHLVGAVPGTVVRLERATRAGRFRLVRTAPAAAGGRFAFVVRPRRSAWYRVVPAGQIGSRLAGAASLPQPGRAVRIEVVARLRAHASRHVLAGGRIAVRGRLRPVAPRGAVRLQLRSGRRWLTVARTRTRAAGRFALTWRAPRIGAHRLRVRFAGSRAALASSRRLALARVYRQGHASWYGPGLYGNSTACGGALTPWRLGVAHRWLPCGTPITFRYRGRSVTVRVIDRGPFIAGREWDLTAATKARLGFGDIGTVWSTR